MALFRKTSVVVILKEYNDRRNLYQSKKEGDSWLLSVAQNDKSTGFQSASDVFRGSLEEIAYGINCLDLWR